MSVRSWRAMPVPWSMRRSPTESAARRAEELRQSLRYEDSSRGASVPDDVSRLAILDVPLPGIAPWDDIVRTQRVWHFHFFDVRDLPEMLIAGREREFLTWFHSNEAVNSRAFTNEAEENYARACSMPGALRAGF
jgi:hypothetical protein